MWIMFKMWIRTRCTLYAMNRLLQCLQARFGFYGDAAMKVRTQPDQLILAIQNEDGGLLVHV